MTDLDLLNENAELHVRVQELESLVETLAELVADASRDVEALFAEVYEAGYLAGRGPASPVPMPHWLALHNPYRHPEDSD